MPEAPIATVRLQDYLKSIDEKKLQIHIRTDMLEELKLAENVEEIYFTTYVDPLDKPKSAGAVDTVGAMCATSLVIKYARRLQAQLQSRMNQLSCQIDLDRSLSWRKERTGGCHSPELF